MTPCILTLAVLPILGPAHAMASDTEQVEWIRRHAVVVDTPEAGHGFADLMPLKKMIGDARIVSLGEPTHGTREAFQFKHRLVEFLASEMGFTIFSIEANMPESYALNPWVLGEEGDGTDEEAARLIAGMYFWTWRTEEVLAMVKWMRDFNARERAAGSGKRIQFTGFDMQTPQVAMQMVRDFVREHDPELEALVVDSYRRASRYDAGRGEGGGGASAFGVATGTFPASVAAGKKLVYSGWIRTRGLEGGWAGLWWRCDRKNGGTGAFDNMQDRGPRGTTEWTHHRIELVIPEDTVNINFGMLMPGKGEAWFDDLKIELDGVEYRPPDDGSLCLDFESDELKGFVNPGRGNGYQTSRSDEQPHGGKGCLRIASVAEVERHDEGEKVDAAEAARQSKGVLDALKDKRAELVASAGQERTDWAIQNARVVWQGYRMFQRGRAGFTARDSAMADNVEWILGQNPDAKIILWAHNGHVMRLTGRMGKFLETKYPGEEMFVLGFATSAGEYTAVAGKGSLRSDLPLQDPPADSVEAILGSAGIASFVLDLRGSADDDPASAWARRSRPMRGIGALEQASQFFPSVVATEYDALVYQARTTAAVQIDDKSRRR